MEKFEQYSISKMDAVDWLNSLPEQSIDLLITDPAYESLEKHRKIGTTTRLSHSKSSSNDWFAIFPNERYLALFQSAYRALKKNSHLYMMCDEETLFLIKPIAEQAGFKFWKSIVWDKQTIGMGYHYRNRTERIAFFEKGKRKLNDLSIPDILSVKRVYKGYPTEKPTELFDILINQSSNPDDVVADCFFGSGSVLVSAMNNGRKALGNDLSQSAHEHFLKRIKVA
ncbi:site-specific DNA-methyltransferase [Vibrio cholerae]|nr:site-specific DNA-methyltransferase [Vibrio cholerae]